MKKLNFILKNADNIICNDTFNYITNLIGNTFMYESKKVTFCGEKNKLFFKSEDNECSFVLEYNENSTNAFIELKNVGMKFDLIVTDFEYIYEDGNIILKYNIEGDEKNIKTIQITY